MFGHAENCFTAHRPRSLFTIQYEARMADREELKRRICESIDKRRSQIESIGDRIMDNPETGFKEFETAKLVSGVMEEFGVSHAKGLAITGVKGVLRGGKPGPTVALIGELDSLVVSDHPKANPETGAAHACGHNAQIAGLMGAMMGLVDAGAAKELAGNIVFFALPAEEAVEIEYRMGLVEQGKLGFVGGKPELVRLGAMDDVDMAVMIHTHSDPDLKTAVVAESNNGCIIKMIRYIGRAAHAGGAPHRGINALNAATVALAAINAQRETFRDEDSIRVHPIITKGGELVNVVPAEVRMETFVRGKTNEGIADANVKVDRALRAGALAIGAQVEIQTIPGYMPMRNEPVLADLYRQNAGEVFGKEEVGEAGHRAGSTDMGDLSHIMPAIHPYMAGASGAGHGADWTISDKEKGYIGPAKTLAMMAVDLLHGGGEKAREVMDGFQAPMTKEEYLDYQGKAFKKETYDGEK